MTLNDLETPKEGFLMNFPQFLTAAHISKCWIVTKWLEIDQDNLQMKFSALNADFNSPGPDSRFKEACAGVCQRRLLTQKVIILLLLTPLA